MTSANLRVTGSADSYQTLGRCIYQVERQMNRSISRELAGTRTLSAGEAILQPKLSAAGREMLAFCCQVLQHLMGSDDKSLIMAEKVESWLPIAAELFGKRDHLFSPVRNQVDARRIHSQREGFGCSVSRFRGPG